MRGRDRTEASRGADAWRDPDRPPWAVRGSAIEHRKVELLAPHLASASSVLDCGCGGGDFFDLLVRRAGRRFAFAAGIDPAARALERARRTGNYDRLIQASLLDARAHVPAELDLALLSDVLMYVAEPARAIEAIAGLLAPRGLLFVSIAMGRRYFGDRDAAALRAALAATALEPLVDEEIDYLALGVPRRRIPMHDLLWHQTHKVVLIHRRP